MPAESLVEVGREAGPVAVDDALAQAPFDRPIGTVLNHTACYRGILERRDERFEGVVAGATPVVDEVETDLLMGGVDPAERDDAPGVDDGGVEPGADALVQEHGVEYVAGGRLEAKRNVGDAEHGEHTGELLLDPFDGLDRLDGVAPQGVVAG